MGDVLDFVFSVAREALVDDDGPSIRETQENPAAQ